MTEIENKFNILVLKFEYFYKYWQLITNLFNIKFNLNEKFFFYKIISKRTFCVKKVIHQNVNKPIKNKKIFIKLFDTQKGKNFDRLPTIEFFHANDFPYDFVTPTISVGFCHSYNFRSILSRVRFPYDIFMRTILSRIRFSSVSVRFKVYDSSFVRCEYDRVSR